MSTRGGAARRAGRDERRFDLGVAYSSRARGFLESTKQRNEAQRAIHAAPTTSMTSYPS